MFNDYQAVVNRRKYVSKWHILQNYKVGLKFKKKFINYSKTQKPNNGLTLTNKTFVWLNIILSCLSQKK